MCTGVALFGQGTQIAYGGLIAAMLKCKFRIIERACGHRCRKSQHHDDSAEGVPEIHSRGRKSEFSILIAKWA